VAEQIARHLPRLLQDLGRLGAAQGQGHKATGLLRLAQVLDDQGAFHLAENVVRVKEGVAIAHSPEPGLDPLVVLGVGAQQVAVPLQWIVPLGRQAQDRDIVNQPAKAPTSLVRICCSEGSARSPTTSNRPQSLGAKRTALSRAAANSASRPGYSGRPRPG